MQASAHILLDLFIGQFAARHDGFVMDSGVHMNENLTPEVALSAFKHGRSLSGYMADAEKRTHIGAIDFDEGTEEDVNAVMATLRSHSIQPLKVASRRGFHVWVFINGHEIDRQSQHIYGMMPAVTVSRALNHALRLTVPELHKGGKVEVFPKPTNGRWPGGTLRMPLFQHPKTGVTYPVYDVDDRVLVEGAKTKDLETLMMYVAGMTTDHGAVNLFAGAAPVDYPKGLDEHAKPRVTDDGDTATQTLALLGVIATPGRATHCPFHDDKRKSLSVALDDERVWCKAPHCEAYNDGQGLGSIQLRQKVEARR